MQACSCCGREYGVLRSCVCQVVAYCNKECQRKDWSKHRKLHHALMKDRGKVEEEKSCSCKRKVGPCACIRALISRPTLKVQLENRPTYDKFDPSTLTTNWACTDARLMIVDPRIEEAPEGTVALFVDRWITPLRKMMRHECRSENCTRAAAARTSLCDVHLGGFHMAPLEPVIQWDASRGGFSANMSFCDAREMLQANLNARDRKLYSVLAGRMRRCQSCMCPFLTLPVTDGFENCVDRKQCENCDDIALMKSHNHNPPPFALANIMLKCERWVLRMVTSGILGYSPSICPERLTIDAFFKEANQLHDCKLYIHAHLFDGSAKEREEHIANMLGLLLKGDVYAQPSQERQEVARAVAALLAPDLPWPGPRATEETQRELGRFGGFMVHLFPMTCMQVVVNGVTAGSAESSLLQDAQVWGTRLRMLLKDSALLAKFTPEQLLDADVGLRGYLLELQRSQRARALLIRLGRPDVDGGELYVSERRTLEAKAAKLHKIAAQLFGCPPDSGLTSAVVRTRQLRHLFERVLQDAQKLKEPATRRRRGRRTPRDVPSPRTQYAAEEFSQSFAAVIGRLRAEEYNASIAAREETLKAALTETQAVLIRQDLEVLKNFEFRAQAALIVERLRQNCAKGRCALRALFENLDFEGAAQRAAPWFTVPGEAVAVEALLHRPKPSRKTMHRQRGRLMNALMQDIINQFDFEIDMTNTKTPTLDIKMPEEESMPLSEPLLTEVLDIKMNIGLDEDPTDRIAALIADPFNFRVDMADGVRADPKHQWTLTTKPNTRPYGPAEMKLNLFWSKRGEVSQAAAGVARQHLMRLHIDPRLYTPRGPKMMGTIAKVLLAARSVLGHSDLALKRWFAARKAIPESAIRMLQAELCPKPHIALASFHSLYSADLPIGFQCYWELSGSTAQALGDDDIDLLHLPFNKALELAQERPPNNLLGVREDLLRVGLGLNPRQLRLHMQPPLVTDVDLSQFAFGEMGRDLTIEKKDLRPFAEQKRAEVVARQKLTGTAALTPIMLAVSVFPIQMPLKGFADDQCFTVLHEERLIRFPIDLMRDAWCMLTPSIWSNLMMDGLLRPYDKVDAAQALVQLEIGLFQPNPELQHTLGKTIRRLRKKLSREYTQPVIIIEDRVDQTCLYVGHMWKKGVFKFMHNSIIPVLPPLDWLLDIVNTRLL